LTENLIQRILDLGIGPVAFLLMLVVGLSLELPAVAAASRKSVRRLVTDLAIAVALPPIVALITVVSIRPSAETAAAILLLAACPVGDIANAYTLLARGSVARSLSLNALTVMLAPISMVAVFSAYPLFVANHHFIAPPPVALALRLAIFLLLPVFIGVMIRHRAARFATRVLPAISRLTTAAILLLLTLVLVNPASRPDNLTGTIFTSAVFLALSTVLCTALLPMLRRNPGEKTALLLCLPVRNVGIASLIAVSLMYETRMLGAMAVYFALEVAIFLPLAVWLGRRAKIPASS
jgi:BASS family bile acid:Na+ symporter